MGISVEAWRASIGSFNDAKSINANKSDAIGEAIEEVFVHIGEGATEEEVLRNVKYPTPCIVAKGNTIFGSNVFHVVVDQTSVATTENGLSALIILFSAYCIFNVCYAPNATSTLEFIQRYIVKLNPEGTGSKAPKKKGNAQRSFNAKVVSLVNSVKDFEQLINQG